MFTFSFGDTLFVDLYSVMFQVFNLFLVSFAFCPGFLLCTYILHVTHHF